MKISRRQLVKNAALFGTLWPILSHASGTRATIDVPRRVVVIFSPNCPHQRGPASGSERGFALHEYWSPLERHRADGLFFAGLTQAGVPFGTHNEYGHQSGGTGALTARTTEGTDNATGPSIDQFIGQGLQASGVVTPRRSLLWGLHNSIGHWGPWYEGVGAPVAPISNPYQALADLSPSLGSDGREAAEALLRRKHFILDQVAADCRQTSRTLGAEARERLDFHCANIESLEASVAASLTAPGPSCVAPDRPMTTLDADANFASPETRDEVMQAFTAMMGLAFTCDITRVIGISFGDTASRFAVPSSYGIAAAGVQDSGDSGAQHHAWTHTPRDEPATYEALRGFYNWYSEKVAAIVDMLKTTMDADGQPLFDSTLVLWTSEMGWNDGGHPNRNIPITLFGNACGDFATGRFFDGDGTPESADIVHQLFVSIIQHAGLTDVRSFGNHGSGGLDWLYT